MIMIIPLLLKLIESLYLLYDLVYFFDVIFYIVLATSLSQQEQYHHQI